LRNDRIYKDNWPEPWGSVDKVCAATEDPLAQEWFASFAALGDYQLNLGKPVMRKLIAGSSIIATIAMSGCASFNSEPPAPAIPSAMRQDVKIYSSIPQYGTPLGPVEATACNGTQETATNMLMDAVVQRRGNGIVQLLCTEQGFSFSCWKSATCTATAINVAPPPPEPPKLIKKRKPKLKKKL
jgi:hypothetical protein